MEVLISSLELPPSVLFLTETWLNDDDYSASFRLSGFCSVVSKTRGSIGGVMLQCRENVKNGDILDCDISESFLVKLETHGNVCGVDNLEPPRNNKPQFVDDLDNFLEEYATKNHPVIVCGDMKLDVFKSNNLTERYLDVVNSNEFELGYSDATHFSNGNASFLDHYLVKCNFHHSCQTFSSHCFSDRYPIVLTVNVESDGSHDLNGFTRDTAFPRDELQVQSFAADLESKLDKLELDNDVNSMFDEFQSLFLEILTKYAPVITLKSGGNKSKSIHGYQVQ